MQGLIRTVYSLSLSEMGPKKLSSDVAKHAINGHFLARAYRPR